MGPAETDPGEPREYTEPPGEVTAAISRLPRKPARIVRAMEGPVPETDTGGRVEDTKALERFTVKELGKLAP